MSTPADSTIVSRLEKERSASVTYLVAIAALAAAVLLRYLLDPWMGNTLPLVTLFGAIAAVVWTGGVRPAIAVAILGYLACSYLFIDPRGRIEFANAGTLISALAYVFTCALIILFGEAARRAHVRASERREVLRVTLRSIGDAVIATDVGGHITYMNPVAEKLTGWTEHEAHGQSLDSIFRIVNEETGRPVDSPAVKALRAGVVAGFANHSVLIRKDGHQ